MSEKAPQTYVLHTFVLALILTVALVLFLRSKWG